VLALAATFHGLVQSSTASADDGNTVRIGVDSNLPKVGLDTGERPAGLFVELIERIAEDRGWQPGFRSCEWSDCLRMLAEGEPDLVPDVALTALIGVYKAFGGGWSDHVPGPLDDESSG